MCLSIGRTANLIRNCLFILLTHGIDNDLAKIHWNQGRFTGFNSASGNRSSRFFSNFIHNSISVGILRCRPIILFSEDVVLFHILQRRLISAAISRHRSPPSLSCVMCLRRWPLVTRLLASRQPCYAKSSCRFRAWLGGKFEVEFLNHRRSDRPYFNNISVTWYCFSKKVSVFNEVSQRHQIYRISGMTISLPKVDIV